MSTPIVLDDSKLAALKEFAEQNPFSLDEIKKIISGESLPPGEREGYTLLLPPCWKLVYSIGVYPKKSEGTSVVRHMSISLSKPGRVANLVLVTLICKALGFPEIEKCYITCEDEIVEVMAEIVPNCSEDVSKNVVHAHLHLI